MKTCLKRREGEFYPAVHSIHVVNYIFSSLRYHIVHRHHHHHRHYFCYYYYYYYYYYY